MFNIVWLRELGIHISCINCASSALLHSSRTTLLMSLSVVFSLTKNRTKIWLIFHQKFSGKLRLKFDMLMMTTTKMQTFLATKSEIFFVNQALSFHLDV